LLTAYSKLAARDAQDGILGFGPWIKTKQPDWRFERYNSFEERFEQIEYNCRVSNISPPQ